MTTSTERALGGVTPSELARTYGTPLLVLDAAMLDERIATFSALGAELDIEVAYAGKALLVVALARRLARSPLGLDVCSLGELYTAEQGGFPAARMTLHGCGKTDEELQAAADGRVGRIVIDNREEIDRLSALADPGRPVRALLRTNTGIEAKTHAYVRTGGERSKFGFSLADLPAAAARAAAAPGIALRGLHAHLGSQLFEPDAIVANLGVALEAYAAIPALRAQDGDLVVGGGFGVDSRPDGRFLDLAKTLHGLARTRDAVAARLRIAPPRVGIEPGRAIVAAAGTSLYAVVAVKTQGNVRYAVTDGGIADNPRPALYDAYHHPELVSRRSEAPPVPTTVCGRSCENDRLVETTLPADLRAGDLLVLRTTGAYTFSMASNYNRFARPAVVAVRDGAHRLVVRRETLADLVRADVAVDAF